MSNEFTSNASGSNPPDMPPHPEAAENLIRQLELDFVSKLDALTGRFVLSVESKEEMKQALVRTSEIANTFVASVDALNEKMDTVKAQGTQILADIEALREEFASMRNLRAGLPQTGDGQIRGDSGEPNTTENQIGSSSTQMGVMPGVGSVKGSEALKQLVSEEKVPGDDLAHSTTTSPPTCLPKTTDPQVTDKKKKDKTLKNAEKRAAKNAEKAAEIARVEAEAQKKAELDRIIKIHIDISRQVVIDFEEGKAKQFLTQRLRFHTKENNIELARLFSVMLDNVSPIIRKYAYELCEVRQGTDAAGLLASELDLFEFFKAYSHYADAYKCYVAGNVERAQQYIHNAVQNYTNHQGEIRGGKAEYEGNGDMKDLCNHICEEAKKLSAENLDWEDSKKFFEEMENCYKAVELPNGRKDRAFNGYTYGQLAKLENPILKVDGHVMSELMKLYKDEQDKSDAVIDYIYLVFSECTL